MNLDRWNEFEQPYINQVVTDLEKEVWKRQAEVDKLHKKIEQIRSECKHEYKLYAKGMYDDFFRCQLCGDNIEK